MMKSFEGMLEKQMLDEVKPMIMGFNESLYVNCHELICEMT